MKRITKIETDDLQFAKRVKKDASKFPEDKSNSDKPELKSTKSLVSRNHDCGFNVHTKCEGSVTGRIFSFLAENTQTCDEWIDLIKSESLIAKKNSVPFYRNLQVTILVVSSSLEAYHLYLSPL